MVVFNVNNTRKCMSLALQNEMLMQSIRGDLKSTEFRFAVDVPFPEKCFNSGIFEYRKSR